MFRGLTINNKFKMKLADSEILKSIEKNEIRIEPFNKEQLGSNSYDVTLDEKLIVYNEKVLDSKKKNNFSEIKIPEKGFVLYPNVLYLGCTNEKTYTQNHIPLIEGKSSIGRLGIFIHATAGFGDIGFEGYWTLEISVVMPVIVYPNMPIGQLVFEEAKGECLNPYGKKKTAKYSGQPKKPIPSMMWKNFKK